MDKCKLGMDIGKSVDKSIDRSIFTLVYYNIWSIVNSVDYSLHNPAGLCKSSMYRFINALVIK
jgi:hypothetical protein